MYLANNTNSKPLINDNTVYRHVIYNIVYKIDSYNQSKFEKDCQIIGSVIAVLTVLDITKIIRFKREFW